jgi:hypothetical protein
MAAGIMFVFAMAAYAQDPGLPDSVIIDTGAVAYNPGVGGYKFIHIYFVTDDSVEYLCLPIGWTSIDGQIFPGRSVWRWPFTSWIDVYDSLLINEGILIQLCFATYGGPDTTPLLFTNHQRLWGLDLRFLITASAVQQFVYIDTIFEATNGSVEMAIGTVELPWKPKVKRGYLRYGFVGVEETRAVPSSFALKQNYPNPFNPETKIDYEIPSAGLVTMDIFNILGQKVKSLLSENKEAGYHTVHWNGTNDNGQAVPSGVYFYKMTAQGFMQTNKMIMLR